jgi:hypothetical protein
MKKKRVLDLSSVVGDFENDDVLHMAPMIVKTTSEGQRLERRTTSRRQSKSVSSSLQENDAAANTEINSGAEEREGPLPQCVSDDDEQVVESSSLESNATTTKRRLDGHRDKKRKADSTSFVFEPISCNKELVDPEFDVGFASSFHILVLSHMVACTQVEEPCARCRLCSPTSTNNSFACPTVESFQTQLPNMAEHLIHKCPDCPAWLRHELQVKLQQQLQQSSSHGLREEYAQCVWGRLRAYSASRR